MSSPKTISIDFLPISNNGTKIIQIICGQGLTKKYLYSEKHKLRTTLILYFNFLLHKYFCKKSKYKIKPNFSKDKIRPPLAIFSAFLKKITMTKSSHFLSPNGQGYQVRHLSTCNNFLTNYLVVDFPFCLLITKFRTAAHIK